MSAPKEVGVPGRGYRKKGGPGEFMRELFPGPRREGVSNAYPLTASSTRKRRVAQRPLAVSEPPLHRSLLWATSIGRTTSSEHNNPPCTTGFREYSF